MLIDRVMIRQGNIGKEAAHRDESKNCLEGDQIFGGFVNIDSKFQYMTLAPGTQLKHVGSRKGFNKMSQEESNAYDAQMVQVEVPPGHMIIFYQTIVHVVRARKVKEPIYRLFLGWRLTQSTTPLMGLERHSRVFTDQGVPPLPSGQEAPMYGSLHLCNWIDKVVGFAEGLVEPCKKVYVPSTGKNAGKEYVIPKKYMPSLQDTGLSLYPEYSLDERTLYTPQPIA